MSLPSLESSSSSSADADADVAMPPCTLPLLPHPYSVSPQHAHNVRETKKENFLALVGGAFSDFFSHPRRRGRRGEGRGGEGACRYGGKRSNEGRRGGDVIVADFWFHLREFGREK